MVSPLSPDTGELVSPQPGETADDWSGGQSVEKILTKFSLFKRDLDKPTISDDAVFKSLELNFDYQLGIHLGLSKSDVKAIKNDHNSDQNRVVSLFWRWQEVKGSDATYLSLMKALIECENKEAAEKLCQYYQDKHQKSSTNEFKRQFSHPALPPNTDHVKYNHSVSSPEKMSFTNEFQKQSSHPTLPPYIDQPKYNHSVTSEKVMLEENTSNDAWKIFDRYHDQLVNILRKDAIFCDSILKILTDKFLIGIAERDAVQQLSNLDIKIKAIVRCVSIFISKARQPTRAFVKFSAIIEEFGNFRAIYEEMKIKASAVGIIIKTPAKLAKAKEPPSLTSKGASADFSDADDAGHDESLLTPSMKKYSRYLKSCYKKERPDRKWSLGNVPSKIYINLAVVCKNEDYRNPFSNSTIHGTNDDIFGYKEPLSLEELCRIEYGDAILIEGAPGIGKSMLAFEMCSRWVKGEALKKYPLLLLLRLRDRVIQNCKSVKDLLGCFLKEQSWKDAAVQDIIDNGGEGLIVILEGFDELPEHLTKRGSLFFQFSNELPCATLVFTSRPSAKHYLKNEIEFERHVEVIGFKKENIDEYIEKFCNNNSEHIATLNQHLDESPKVRDCLYIPVNLVIVCDIFQKYIMSEEQVPFKGIVTSTKLYEAMIKMLLYRHIKSQTQELVRVDLHNLPHPIKEKFTTLCQIAYNGLRNRATKLLYYADDDFETLGMMQKEVQVYPGTGDVTAYSFLHLTIQEFLAAYHISQMQKAEIEVIFNKLKNVMKFKTMLCFLSGLTGLQSITPHFDHNLYKLNLFHYLYESGNESLVKMLFGNKDEFYKVRRLIPSPSPQDMFILGKCIALSSCQWGLSFTLRGMTFEHIQKFQTGLFSVECDLSCTIKDISFSLNPIGDEGMMELLKFPEHVIKNLVSLQLMSCHLHSHAATEFSKELKKFSSLKTLFFHNNLFKEGEQLCLIEAMIPLQYHYVTLSKLSPDECEVLLTKVSSITEVYLYQLGSSSIEKVIECLPNSLSLEVLHIEQSHCTPENLSLLPTTLPSSTLTKLELVNCAIDSSSVRTVIDAVLMSPHLEALNLRDNFIDDEGSAHLCSMLKQLFGLSEEPATDYDSSYSFKKLKFLDIGHNPFTGHGISSFIDELAHFKSDSINFILSLSLGWKDQLCEHVSFTKAEQHLKFECNEDN
ncbi:PREDICTED: NACHT, LRR and PYD domains-containing protein 3-like [Amphimedon queenslandica]|uniref:Death domain-containing protein n=1 Tax=Amphimedon queenslandica TaxID=400682 RepID=A0A1X7U2P8_AMPQE|nr:PREDICTED: NACHT, LRR and PYD domains-containing protein 3-like [Amphimedon queenslandica]|eukprot:XP_019856357.1 PREDICTED: NACHT, LRR and PYD domains-containing protein 3-like [Amphimedon queenslandica]